MRRAALLPALAALLLAGCGDDAPSAGPPAARTATAPAGTTGATPPERPREPRDARDQRISRAQRRAIRAGRLALVARVLRATRLRDRPGGGRVVARIGRRTAFGSEQVLAVVGRRGDAIAVLHEALPNGEAGWVPARDLLLGTTDVRLEADLSARRVTVRRAGRPVRRLRVAIGRPASPTPAGRFAVTDRVRITGGPGPYGCCAVALSGRQPDVPQGWSGGDRLAIHGTDAPASIGTAASLGCLRAAERDLRWLMRNVPLGSPVRIRA